jgi:hypothetical protein
VPVRSLIAVPGRSEFTVSANGIDATTGDYLLPGLVAGDLAAVAQRAAFDDLHAMELRRRHRRRTEPTFAPRHGIDAHDLAQAGWGVVFAADADPAVRTALRPLLELRRGQAGTRVERRYRELAGPDGLRSGESKQDFTRRHGSGPGPVDPDVLPYYLLLVGGPEEIPFGVQYQLGVQHAVGRIAFDELSAYRRYAENVLAAETAAGPGPGSEPLRMSVFAPRNEGDLATALSAEQLARPLAEALAAEPGWQVRCALGSDASRGRLVEQLTEPHRPDLLFAAAHGVGLPSGHAEQRSVQGALLCQDWPGPRHGPVDPEHWFGAPDVAALGAADLTGMIAFLVACFGAGTPRVDDYGRGGADPAAVAPAPFVAALPQALLGREGGAQAVIGHVDRTWSCSFLWPGIGRQIEVYRSALGRLCDGSPLGPALEFVADRYAELTSDLGAALAEIRLGRRADHAQLAELWTACVDMRNLVLLGDPAVRAARAAGSARPPARDVVTVTGAAGTAGSAASLDRAGSAASGPMPVEIATHLADDPATVGYDPVTGRLTGARPHLVSRVELDGAATHVVGVEHLTLPAEQRAALADVHARLIRVSVEIRRQR